MDDARDCGARLTGVSGAAPRRGISARRRVAGRESELRDLLGQFPGLADECLVRDHRFLDHRGVALSEIIDLGESMADGAHLVGL